MQRILARVIVFVAASALAANARAAGLGGELESIDATARSIVLKVGGDKLYTLTVEPTAVITLDGKPTTLAELQPGTKAYVSHTNQLATKLAARTSTPSTAVRPPPRRPTSPTPIVPKATTPSQSDLKQADHPWPQFRGPNRDGISTETGLLTSWPSSGPKLLWTASGLGEGYASVSVAGGLVLTMGNQGDREAVLAVDIDSGKPVWGTPTGSAFRERRGDGPRCVPTVDGDLVYALGANGDLACLELTTGKVRWQMNILQQFAAQNISWGISESPLIDGDRLICTPGGRGGTMVALDKNTGRPIWTSISPQGEPAGYASVVVAEPGGVRQYVQLTSTGTIGVRASDGAFMWRDDSMSNDTANCSAPVVVGDAVFASSGYGTGGTLLRLVSQRGATAAMKVYNTSEMQSHHGGMVAIGGFLYGSSDPGVLRCLDLATGRVLWENRSVGKGSLTAADGHLYLRSERGPVALIEASSAGYVEKGRFDQPDRSGSSALRFYHIFSSWRRRSRRAWLAVWSSRARGRAIRVGDRVGGFGGRPSAP